VCVLTRKVRPEHGMQCVLIMGMHMCDLMQDSQQGNALCVLTEKLQPGDPLCVLTQQLQPGGFMCVLK
jgi:hypothetical protein